jgi:LPXTG-motif cell wall-anchored protein
MMETEEATKMKRQDHKLNVGEVQNHFSIRELSVGVCSVLLAATMWTVGNSQVAHADTTTKTATVVQSHQEVPAAADESKEVAVSKEAAKSSAESNSQTEQADTNAETSNESLSSKDTAPESSKGSETSAPTDTQKPAVEGEEKKQDKTEETTNGVSQQVVEGEEPDLGQFDLTTDFLRDHGISVEGAFDSNDPDSPKLTWVNKPDVSKVGTTTGTAKLTYVDPSAEPDENGNYPTKSVLVNIKYNVRAGKKKSDDEVRNTLTYVDQDDNDVVASYTWIGKKAENEYSDPVFAIPSGTTTEYDEAVKSLGYIIDQSSSRSNDVAYFGTKDVTQIVPVKKISNSDQPITVGQAEEQGEWSRGGWMYPDGYNNLGYIDGNNYIVNPADVIANTGSLPAGTKISWKVDPTYSFTIDSDDPRGNVNSVDHLPTNDPIVMIEEPGKDPILITLTDADKEVIALPAYGEGYPQWGNAETTISADPNSVSPLNFLFNKDALLRALSSEGENDSNVSDAVKAYFLNEANWTWEVQPDLSHPGYTVGYAKFVAPNDGPDSVSAASTSTSNLTAEDIQTLTDMAQGMGYSHGFMIHVLPNTTSESQTKTRTIIVTDPDGTQNTIEQTVTFTETSTQTLADGPVETTWNQTSGQWDAYTAPEIPGYTALGSPVKAETVTLETNDQTVYITYVSDEDPQPTTPTVKEEDKHTDSDKPAENDPVKTPEKKSAKEEVAKKNLAAPAKLTSVKTTPAAVKTNQKVALPQTGAKKSSVLAIGLGLIGLALTAMFSSVLNRKRQ